MQMPGYPKGRPGEERVSAQLGALRGNSSRGRFRGTAPRVPPRGCVQICPRGVKRAAWGLLREKKKERWPLSPLRETVA